MWTGKMVEMGERTDGKKGEVWRGMGGRGEREIERGEGRMEFSEV